MLPTFYSMEYWIILTIFVPFASILGNLSTKRSFFFFFCRRYLERNNLFVDKLPKIEAKGTEIVRTTQWSMEYCIRSLRIEITVIWGHLGTGTQEQRNRAVHTHQASAHIWRQSIWSWRRRGFETQNSLNPFRAVYVLRTTFSNCIFNSYYFFILQYKIIGECWSRSQKWYEINENFSKKFLKNAMSSFYLEILKKPIGNESFFIPN